MRSAEELVNRMKNAMQQVAPAEPIDRGDELIPGAKYRGESGRMVTVLRVSELRVMYYREGYRETCEMGRMAFNRQFRKVQP